MVSAPGNLYGILERSVVDRHTHDGLVRLGDRDDDYDLGTERKTP